MSMMQSIFVVLIGATVEKVKKAMNDFRLSTPGIGAPYYVALDAPENGKIIKPESIPTGLITLWVCLDKESLDISQKLHERDKQIQKYGRGFYDEIFPDASVLIGDNGNAEQFNKKLQELEKKITEAWYSTS